MATATDRQRFLISKAPAPLVLALRLLVRLGYRSSRAWMVYLAPGFRPAEPAPPFASSASRDH
jgi:hypothetical protein